MSLLEIRNLSAAYDGTEVAMRRMTDALRVDGSELHGAQALPMLERLLPAMREPGAAQPVVAPRYFVALPPIKGRHLQLADATRVWATPADTQRVAQEIAGAHFQEIPGFSHFPMVENPDDLLPFLRAPLGTLRARVAQVQGDTR